MEIKQYLVQPDDSIRNVMQVINRNKDGIALVVDKNSRLVGTVTDGDIRRFMISDQSFEAPCSEVMNDRPIMADIHADRATLVSQIKTNRIRNIPIVDDEGRPVRVVSFNELINGQGEALAAVIMAGGEGRRLRPLTEHTPKPMLKVGGTPVIEQIVGNLKTAGIQNIFISVNYRSEVIESHFGDGSAFGVRIQYLKEEKKLGTAGSLSLLKGYLQAVRQPVLVMNGDVVTDMNFCHFLEFHQQHRSVLSVAAIEYHLNIPYGVLDINGHFVNGLEEKPTQRFLCNAGIYVIESDMIHLVPEDTYYDMTDLLGVIVKRGLPVSAFPMHEHWVDIGHKEDLKRVCEQFEFAGHKKG